MLHIIELSKYVLLESILLIELLLRKLVTVSFPSVSVFRTVRNRGCQIVLVEMVDIEDH